MKKDSVRAPWTFGMVFAAAILSAAWPLLAPKPKTVFASARFARLPILEGGRMKPLDSFARSSLLMIRGTQSFQAEGRTVTAAQWLLDALFRTEVSDAYKIFTIDDPDLLGLLKLDGQHDRRFAYWQIDEKGFEAVRAQAERAESVEAGRRTRFQSAAINLASRLELYERIKNSIAVPGPGNPLQELVAFAGAMPGALRAIHPRGRVAPADAAALATFTAMAERYRYLDGAAAFFPVPPPAGRPGDTWVSFGAAALEPGADESVQGVLTAYARMAQSYRASDPAGFASAVDDVSRRLGRERPAESRHARDEALFNDAQPFLSGMALYVAALLAVFAWWATRRPAARSASLALLSAAFAVHTAGLAARVILQGRPPVTNLYSSAVFIGWFAAGLGLAAERAHKKGFAAASGALVGFCTLLIAHHLAASGDTMEMMRAVLDSNFWLATHVVTVTMGYSATFLAGMLGIAWILRRQFVAKPDPETTRALVSLAYGVVAFSLLFSFIGTVLGGIWADQSWGRFWGWDPKENGALLIVLWNATILHCRWAGYVRERGLMVMTVGGNIITALSWFGVNMLGIGLHSYGFMDQAFWWLLAFGVSQAVLIVLGLFPSRLAFVLHGESV
ncbi:MAG: cytochrome c biogenesis protein [Elusimicrobiota bacterium]